MLAGMFERVETVEVGDLTRPQLESILTDVAALESFLASRRLEVMAAIDGLGDGGLPSDTVLRSKAKVGDKAAKRAAGTAKTLELMPKTAQRLRAGEITEAHAQANVSAAEKAGDPAKADAELNQSPIVPPADLHAKRTRTWAADNESRDKVQRRYDRQRRNRKAIIGRSEDNGSWSLYATTDTAEGRDLEGLIEEEADRLFRVEDGGRGGDSERSRSQRLLDALVNLVKRGAGQVESSASRPKPRHPRFQPMLRITLRGHLDDLDGELVGDGPLPRSIVEQVLCSSGLDVVITADDGSPLWLGRTSREASAAQWRALIERDEGCVICGADPSRCEAHHLTWWRRGGTTDIDNLVLLCSTHHHDLHDRGLELRRRDGTWLLEPKPVHQRQPAASMRGHRNRREKPARAA